VPDRRELEKENTMPYMFTRATRLAPGNVLDSMAWAVKMTEKVNAAGGPQFKLWTRALSPATGTISWSTVVGDIGELRALEDTLMADGGYHELLHEGAQYGDGSGANDGLGSLVHADPDGFDSAQYASITLSQLAPGMAAAGIELGVEICQHVKSVTGSSTSFGSSLTGPYGQVAWFVMSDSIEQVQAGNEAISADADWWKLMDERASKAYVAAASERFMMRRIA
jgi:hypothetical protein